MPNLSLQNDPACNPNFRRRWSSPLPLSQAEARLNQLRADLGNIEGTQVFREEQRNHKKTWL